MRNVSINRVDKCKYCYFLLIQFVIQIQTQRKFMERSRLDKTATKSAKSFVEIENVQLQEKLV